MILNYIYQSEQAILSLPYFRSNYQNTNQIRMDSTTTYCIPFACHPLNISTFLQFPMTTSFIYLTPIPTATKIITCVLLRIMIYIYCYQWKWLRHHESNDETRSRSPVLGEPVWIYHAWIGKYFRNKWIIYYLLDHHLHSSYKLFYSASWIAFMIHDSWLPTL